MVECLEGGGKLGSPAIASLSSSLLGDKKWLHKTCFGVRSDLSLLPLNCLFSFILKLICGDCRVDSFVRAFYLSSPLREVLLPISIRSNLSLGFLMGEILPGGSSGLELELAVVFLLKVSRGGAMP